MYSRGLRPFQPVIYLTSSLRDQLVWKGHGLQDLFNMNVLSKTVSDQDLLVLLKLNDESDDKRFPVNPVALGIETMMRLWRQGLEDDQTANDTLDRIEILLSMRDHSALETALTSNNDTEQSGNGFEIHHDEKGIYVVLKKDEVNLLDKEQINQIRFDIAKMVCKTYCLYVNYHEVANTDWFKMYIEQL